MKVTTQINVTDDTEKQKEDLWKEDEIEFPDYGVENWQNLRDLYQTGYSTELSELLTGMSPWTEGEKSPSFPDFCFILNRKGELYIILEHRRSEFHEDVALLAAHGPGRDAFEKAEAYFEQKWNAYRASDNMFDYKFNMPLTTKK